MPRDKSRHLVAQLTSVTAHLLLPDLHAVADVQRAELREVIKNARKEFHALDGHVKAKKNFKGGVVTGGSNPSTGSKDVSKDITAKAANEFSTPSKARKAYHLASPSGSAAGSSSSKGSGNNSSATVGGSSISRSFCNLYSDGVGVYRLIYENIL